MSFAYEEDDKNKTASELLSVVVSEPHFTDNSTTWLMTAKGLNPGHVVFLIEGVVDSHGSNSTSYK